MKMLRARRSFGLVAVIVVFCASLVAAPSQKSSGRERLDRSKIDMLLAHLTQALSRWRFDEVSRLVGKTGVVFTEYGADPESPGFNNGRDVAKKLEAAFRDAKVSCQGYSFYANALPDKAIIYYSISPANLVPLNVSTQNTDVIAFHFFRLKAGWELVGVTPVDKEYLPIRESMRPCPRAKQ